jgi:hypothetical protein
MILYHCQIDLHDGAKALAFASAVQGWMSHLKANGQISGWRLMRRKLGLASGPHSDFLLEIELPGLSALDNLFQTLAETDDLAQRRYDQMHQMIERAEVGLYRPYPDQAQRERIALI